MTKGYTLERVREEMLAMYKAAALYITHPAHITKESMKQLGRTGLRQRAASAVYAVLAAMLFNIIHIVFFA